MSRASNVWMTLLTTMLLVAHGPPARAQSGASANRESDPLAPAVLVGGSIAESDEQGSPAAFAWKWKTKRLGRGHETAIVVDSHGRPHVLYAELNGLIGERLVHAWPEGGAWLSETVEAGIEYANPMAAAIDDQDVLHLAYPKNVSPYPNDYEELHYARSDAGGWTVETLEEGGRNPAIAVDEQGGVHILHVRRVDEPGHHDELRLIESTAQGWVSEVVAEGVHDLARNSLVLHEGTVHAAFSNQYPEVLRVASRENGAWQLADVDSGHNANLVFDASGTPHVLYNSTAVDSPYWGDDELRHAWRDGSSWVHQALITPASVFGALVEAPVHAYALEPAAGVDFAGRIQLAFGLYFAKGEASVHGLAMATWQDGTWFPQAFGPKGSGYRARLAIGRSGIVHVATSMSKSSDPTRVFVASRRGRKLRLAVVPPGGGIIVDTLTGMECSSKLTERVTPGTQVVLEALPEAGFVFEGWSKGGSGTDPTCTVTLDKGRTVIARFSTVP